MLGPARPGQSLPETLYHMLFYFSIHDFTLPRPRISRFFSSPCLAVPAGLVVRAC